MYDEIDSTSESELFPISEGVGEREVIRNEYSWESIEPSTAVVETVAAAVGRDPTNIEPLYDVLDPSALNDLISSVESDRLSAEPTDVSFRYGNHIVTVRSDGEIIVAPLAEDLF